MNESPRLLLNGMAVSRETNARLQKFETVFRKWSSAVNLVASSTKTDLWSRHIADSAQIYRLSPQPKIWLDIGSGAGFPGMITAILLAEQEAGWVHLVESNHKKAAFLRAALIETQARASIYLVRVEEAKAQIPHVDAISARALADLPTLLRWVEPWARENLDLKCYFHKGRDYETEIRNTHGRYQFDLLKHPSEIERDLVILEISKLALTANELG